MKNREFYLKKNNGTGKPLIDIIDNVLIILNDIEKLLRKT